MGFPGLLRLAFSTGALRGGGGIIPQIDLDCTDGGGGAALAGLGSFLGGGYPALLAGLSQGGPSALGGLREGLEGRCGDG